MSVAIKLEVFACKYRADHLAWLKAKGHNPQPGDGLFLDDEGCPLTRGAITKDFQRLCRTAGINTKACLSMFRHRFITLMVAIHLRKFLDAGSGGMMHRLSDSDNRTVLTKVMKLTGHKSVEGLLHYIDWAWEELGAFDAIEAARDIVLILEDLRSIPDFQIEELGRMSKAEIQKAVHEFREHWTGLQAIRRALLDALDVIGGQRNASDHALELWR